MQSSIKVELSGSTGIIAEQSFKLRLEFVEDGLLLEQLVVPLEDDGV